MWQVDRRHPGYDGPAVASWGQPGHLGLRLELTGDTAALKDLVGDLGGTARKLLPPAAQADLEKLRRLKGERAALQRQLAEAKAATAGRDDELRARRKALVEDAPAGVARQLADIDRQLAQARDAAAGPEQELAVLKELIDGLERRLAQPLQAAAALARSNRIRELAAERDKALDALTAACSAQLDHLAAVCSALARLADGTNVQLTRVEAA